MLAALQVLGFLALDDPRSGQDFGSLFVTHCVKVFCEVEVKWRLMWEKCFLLIAGKLPVCVTSDSLLPSGETLSKMQMVRSLRYFSSDDRCSWWTVRGTNLIAQEASTPEILACVRRACQRLFRVKSKSSSVKRRKLMITR